LFGNFGSLAIFAAFKSAEGGPLRHGPREEYVGDEGKAAVVTPRAALLFSTSISSTSQGAG